MNVNLTIKVNIQLLVNMYMVSVQDPDYYKDVTKMQNRTINRMIHRMSKFHGKPLFYQYSLALPL